MRYTNYFFCVFVRKQQSQLSSKHTPSSSSSVNKHDAVLNTKDTAANHLVDALPPAPLDGVLITSAIDETWQCLNRKDNELLSRAAQHESEQQVSSEQATTVAERSTSNIGNTADEGTSLQICDVDLPNQNETDDDDDMDDDMEQHISENIKRIKYENDDHPKTNPLSTATTTYQHDEQIPDAESKFN